MTSKVYRRREDRYWAAEDSDAIGAAVRHQWERYQQRIRETGRHQIWRVADLCYHGRNPDGSYANAHAVSFGGAEGEIAQLHVGHYRQLVRSMHTLATQQRPAIEATANSNDPESVSSTIVARQLLEYDLDDSGLEEALYGTHTRALVYSEGYLVQTWDRHAGELVGTAPVAPEMVDASEPGLPEGVEGVEMPVREGACRTDVRSPMDVARDLDLDSAAEPPWYVVRTRVHRWELASRFPESGEARRAVLEAPSAPGDQYTLWEHRTDSSGDESDYVHMLTLYHMPTDALPDGRIVEVVDGHVLYDAPYEYDHCVVHRDMPSDELDRPVGYGDTWDLLALSQALDAVESGMLTSSDAGATPSYVASRGQKVDVKMLEGGLQVIEYDADDGRTQGPQLLERAEVRSSDFNYSSHLRQSLEILSGINATTRGVAESQVKSGADRALIATMAVQANSWQQRGYANLLRSVLNGRVQLYRQHMTSERVVEIAGRDKAGHVAVVSADRLAHIRRVRVELGPPDLRTIEGRIRLADAMLERYGPDVVTPAKYMTVRQTGRLDDLDDPVSDHKVRARRENDLIREGRFEMVQALVVDHHACHIAEHAREIVSIDLWGQSDAIQQIQALDAHISAHVQLWQSASPEILSATGQGPSPSTLMGPPGGPGGGPPPNEELMPAPMGAAVPEAEAMAPGDLPQQPMNPMTGARGVPGMPATEGVM
jgi:hypothetical protein